MSAKAQKTDLNTQFNEIYSWMFSLFCKYSRIAGVMPLWIGLASAVRKSKSLIVVLFGQGSGADLIKTLHLRRALGTLNSTIRPKPSSFNDSVALVYSASAMAFADLLPFWKLL